MKTKREKSKKTTSHKNILKAIKDYESGKNLGHEITSENLLLEFKKMVKE